jgi:hypothetical protein
MCWPITLRGWEGFSLETTPIIPHFGGVCQRVGRGCAKSGFPCVVSNKGIHQLPLFGAPKGLFAGRIPPLPSPSPPFSRLIRVHHLGSPPEEKHRISLSAPSTALQHFTTNDINPNKNTRALRRRLSHKPTPPPSNNPSRAAHKHPNAYTNHNQHSPTAEPARHRCQPKHPRPVPTKTLLYPRTIPIPTTTHPTPRQVRQQIPHILRTLTPKHHQTTPQPMAECLPSNRYLQPRPCRTKGRQRTRPTPPQRTKQRPLLLQLFPLLTADSRLFQ